MSDEATITVDMLRTVANGLERSAESNGRSRADADNQEAASYFNGKAHAFQAAATRLRGIADGAEANHDCQP